MNDFDNFPLQETNCLVSDYVMEKQINQNSKKSILRKASWKPSNIQKKTSITTPNNDDIQEDHEEDIPQDTRRMSCFNWELLEGDKKKDSLTSESEVFEIVHLDSGGGHVPLRDKIVTG